MELWRSEGIRVCSMDLAVAAAAAKDGQGSVAVLDDAFALIMLCLSSVLHHDGQQSRQHMQPHRSLPLTS